MKIIDNSNKFVKEEYINQNKINLNKYVEKIIFYSEDNKENPTKFYVDNDEITSINMNYYDTFFESTQGNVKNKANFEILETNINTDLLFDNNNDTYVEFDQNSYIIVKINESFRIWTKSYETNNISNLLIQKLDENYNVIETIDNQEEFKIKNVFTLSSIELETGIYKFKLLPNDNNEYIRKDSEWFFERKIILYKSDDIAIKKNVSTIEYDSDTYFKFEIYTFEINEINDYGIKAMVYNNKQSNKLDSEIIFGVDVEDSVDVYSDFESKLYIQNIEILSDEYGKYALIGQGQGGIIGLKLNNIKIDYQKGLYWYGLFGNDINGDYNFVIGNVYDDYNSEFAILKFKNNAHYTSLYRNSHTRGWRFPSLFQINKNTINLFELNIINKIVKIYLNGKKVYERKITYTDKTIFNTIFIGNDTKDFNFNFGITNYIKLYSTCAFNRGMTESAREELLENVLGTYNLKFNDNKTQITNQPIILNSYNFKSINHNVFKKGQEKKLKSIKTKIDNKIEIIESNIINKLNAITNINLTAFENYEIISSDKFKTNENINEYISNGKAKQPLIKEITDNGEYIYTVDPNDIINGIYKLDNKNIKILNLKNKATKVTKSKGNNEINYRYYSKTPKYPSLGFNFEIKQSGLNLIDSYKNNILKLNSDINDFLILNNYYGVVPYFKNDNDEIETEFDISTIKYNDEINWNDNEMFDNYFKLYETKSISATVDITDLIKDTENEKIKIKFKAYRIDNWKKDDKIYIKVNGKEVWSKTAETDLVFNDDGKVNATASLASWQYCNECSDYATYDVDGNTLYYGVKGYVDVEIDIPFDKSVLDIEIGSILSNDKTQALAGFSDFEVYLIKNINDKNTLIVPNVKINITNHQNKNISFNTKELNLKPNFPYLVAKKDNERLVGFYYDINISSEMIETFEELNFNILSKNNPYLVKDCSLFTESGYYTIYPNNNPINVYFDYETKYIYIFEHIANKKINYELKNKIYYNNLDFSFNDNDGMINLYNPYEYGDKSIEFEFVNPLEKEIQNAKIEIEYEGEFELYIKKYNGTFIIVYSNTEINGISNIELNNLNTNQINMQFKLKLKNSLKITKIKFAIKQN